ncbi:MAG: transposase [Candidatus Daviesbacteria bacterium]
MAARNSIKIYSEDGYYHIYNRGVEKRLIFQDSQDYGVFLSYLKEYLLPKDEKGLYNQLSNSNISSKERDKILKQLRLNNFADEITLLAHCLMPNHFHFLVKQKDPNSIDKFMNSIGSRYAMFFNKKYKRVGALYQDVYKAVMVESEPQLLYLSSYIHRNPLYLKSASKGDVSRGYLSQPSSYLDYLEQRNTAWVHPEEILSFFSKNNPLLSYQSFVEQSEELLPAQELLIDI